MSNHKHLLFASYCIDDSKFRLISGNATHLANQRANLYTHTDGATRKIRMTGNFLNQNSRTVIRL